MNYVFRKHLSILGSTMAPQDDFRTVMGLIFEGKLKPIVGQVMPLKEAAKAHRIFESGEVFGKLVLVP